MRRKKTNELSVLHPVVALLVLALATIIISGSLNAFNVQSTFNKVSPISGDFQVTSEAVTSLLSLSGLKYIFTTTVSSFANYTVLSNLIILLLGFGIMVKSGFLKTIIRLLTKKAKKTTVTFILVLICILSSITGDLSYLVFIPFSALLFLYGKRNPMIGIITSFAALTCGNAISIFLTSIDSSLIKMTIENANILQPYNISSLGYIIVMPLLVILLSFVITYITENIIAKRLPKYDFPEEEVEEELVLSKKNIRGLTLAGLFGITYLVIFIYNIVPGLPLSGALLDYHQSLYIDKLFSYDSFFSNGFVFVIAVLFIILGLAYGIGAKTIKNNNDFIDALGHSLNGIGKMLVIIFASATFLNIFKQSNIGNFVVGGLTSIICNSNFAGIILLVLLFICGIVSAIFVPNALSSWSILSGVIPTLMQAGISPEFAQLVFRLGTSVSLGLTPVFAYFIVYLAYLENYNQNGKPITFGEAIKNQLPYAIATCVVYLVFITIWYLLGFPLGVGTSVALGGI